MDRHGDTKEQKKLIANARRLANEELEYDCRLHFSTPDGNIVFVNRNYETDYWILLVHGLGSSAYKMSPYAKHFLEKGFNVLTLDIKGGNLNVAKTLKSSIEHTLLKYSHVRKIGVFAQSLGASATIEVYSKLERKPDFLILESPVESLPDGIDRLCEKHNLLKLLKKLLLKWCNKHKEEIPYAVEDFVKYIKTPSLWLSSKRDWLCPMYIALRMHNNLRYLGRTAKFEAFESQHCRSMWREPEKFWKAVDSFISNYVIR